MVLSIRLGHNLILDIMSPIDAKTREQIVANVVAAREGRTTFLAQMKERQKQGWQAAHKAAVTLKEGFGATRVVLFGSMLDHGHMTWHSDLDLAVWGIQAEDYLRAGVAVEKGHPFTIDLIDAETAPPHILEAIHQGIDL